MNAWIRLCFLTGIGVFILTSPVPRATADGEDSLPEIRQQDSALDAAVFAPEVDQSQSVWWIHRGKQLTAVANFGPFLRSEADYWFRRWVLVIRVPDSPQPLTCLQGILNIDDTSPLWAKGGSFRVHLSPRSGESWGDVILPSDIESIVEEPE